MKLISILLLVIFLPNITFAKIYKCTINGELVYQSEPCPVIETDENKKPFFGFDDWKFGTSILFMKQKARNRQLAMSPGTSTFISKYNEKILNNQPNARIYIYRTKIMEKLTTVKLFFTKTTEELYKVKIVFHVIQLKPEERGYFYEALHEQLSGKYGKPQKVSKEIVKKNNKGLAGFLTKGISESMVGSLQAWGIGTDNVVTLSYKNKYHLMHSYELTYKFMPLVEQNKKEITYDLRLRTNKSMIKDGGRL